MVDPNSLAQRTLSREVGGIIKDIAQAYPQDANTRYGPFDSIFQHLRMMSASQPYTLYIEKPFELAERLSQAEPAEAARIMARVLVVSYFRHHREHGPQASRGWWDRLIEIAQKGMPL